MSPVVSALMAALDEEHAEAVVAHRRTTIKKPLTEFAAKLLAKKFAACADPNAAAEMMIEKCWQGFEPAWIKSSSPVSRYERNADAAHGSIADQLFGSSTQEDDRYGQRHIDADFVRH